MRMAGATPSFVVSVVMTLFDFRDPVLMVVPLT